MREVPLTVLVDHAYEMTTHRALETGLNSAGWAGMTPDGATISARALGSSNLYSLELEAK